MGALPVIQAAPRILEGLGYCLAHNRALNDYVCKIFTITGPYFITFINLRQLF